MGIAATVELLLAAPKDPLQFPAANQPVFVEGAVVIL
jgi:hypothetical protein